MDKSEVFERELTKLTEVFSDIDPSKAQLVQGLIQDAAFLYAENYELRSIISRTGMVKIHPQHPEIQKPIEAARQYLKNANSYAVIIKTLNGVLNKNILDEDDGLDEFE
ncbi:hypothetical protein ACE3MS_15425 [Paenibacillus dendritiformis]|uniref:hypothetical protein n=1 Tax=Paenibacillus dendritiformis TaxID=130049 RepID=UPI00366825B5